MKYGKFENVNIQNEKLVYKRQSDNQTVFVALNLTNHDERIGFDTGYNAKLTDVLNDNEVFDVNGYYEISMKPYSARILVVNDGSFKVDFEKAVEIKHFEHPKRSSKVENNQEPVRLEKVYPGIYRHFKGTEYEVLGFATHTENGEKLVIYMENNNPQKVWVRPYDMFCDVVEYNGKKVLRFTPLA